MYESIDNVLTPDSLRNAANSWCKFDKHDNPLLVD